MTPVEAAQRRLEAMRALQDDQVPANTLVPMLERMVALETLAQCVADNLCGLPDHPWIPGTNARPVRDTLLALGTPAPTDDMGRSLAIG